MSKINFINAPIFQDLLVVKSDNSFLDLHNYFECIKITVQKRLIFTFVSQKYQIDLIFSDYQIISHLLPLEVAHSHTLDLFYRGRYEKEYSLNEVYQGKQCFYMEFMESQALCILAKNVYCLTHQSMPMLSIFERESQLFSV
jgi:hypothetical protein